MKSESPRQRISDGAQGFCRGDAATPGVTPGSAQPGATVYNPGSPDYCFNGNITPGIGGELVGGNTAISAGQVAYQFDPAISATHWVYLPDTSSHSEGVWAAQFDPITETIIPDSAHVIAPGGGLGRSSSVAIGYGTPSTGRAMSQTTTCAPSRANPNACDRP